MGYLDKARTVLKAVKEKEGDPPAESSNAKVPAINESSSADDDCASAVDGARLSTTDDCRHDVTAADRPQRHSADPSHCDISAKSDQSIEHNSSTARTGAKSDKSALSPSPNDIGDITALCHAPVQFILDAFRAESDKSAKTPWDPVMAGLLHHWLDVKYSRESTIIPAKICDEIRSQIAQAFDSQDIAAAYVAMLRYQLIERTLRQRQPRRSRVARSIQWPDYSYGLVWKTPPEAVCPKCHRCDFWRVDDRGFFCSHCCPPRECQPVEHIQAESMHEHPTPPRQLYWWHTDDFPPVWLMMEYDFDERPFRPPTLG